MTATINASAGGVVLTSDTSGALALQSGGVTKLAVSSTGPSLTWPDSSTPQTRIGWEKIAADVSPSGAASVEFTGIPSSVKAIRLLYDLIPATNNVTLRMRLSQGGVIVTSSSYGYTNFFGASNGGSSSSSATTTSMAVSGTVGIPNSGANIGMGGEILLPHVQTASYPRVHGMGYAMDFSGSIHYITSVGMIFGIAGAVDGVQLLFSSGNIASGRVSILGLRG